MCTGLTFLDQVHENEVMRAYKTVNDTYIEPISFTVPRRAETFQADIFPPAIGSKPACTAKEWLDGKTAIPAKIDFESIYDGGAPKEVAADYKPPVQSTPSTPKAETKKAEPAKEEPKPSTSRGPPATIKDQKSSISAMANKFQESEEDEEEEDDDASSFEEVSRPAQRSTMPIRSDPPKPAAAASPAKATPSAAPAAAASPAIGTPVRAATPVRTPTGASTPVSAGVETSLEQIKQLIEGQTKVITAQNEKIANLTSEVESLKRKIGSSSGSQDQSERIRQLELELEEARS